MKFLNELLCILRLIKDNKNYVIADRLKKLIEETFSIRIQFTENCVTYYHFIKE